MLVHLRAWSLLSGLRIVYEVDDDSHFLGHLRSLTVSGAAVRGET